MKYQCSVARRLAWLAAAAETLALSIQHLAGRLAAQLNGWRLMA